MTKEEIMKPENLVYQKPRLLNDNPMHYCPGCSHGVVHKLIAEVIEEMGMAEKAIGISPGDVLYSCTTILTSIVRKQLMDVRLHWPEPSNAYGPTVWYSHIREMVTWLVSVQQKQSIL